MQTFHADFDKAPLGMFKNKELVFPPSELYKLVDNDPTGHFYQIVRELDGHNALRMWYPANRVGMTNTINGKQQVQNFHLRMGIVRAPVRLKFRHMFENGADLAQGPGKLAPQLGWGATDTEPTGVDAFIIWNSHVGSNAKPYNPILQEQNNGHMWITPAVISKRNITLGSYTDFEIMLHVDEHGVGHSEFKMDGQMWHTQNEVGPRSHNDTVVVNCGFWAGGGKGAEPKKDVFGRLRDFSIEVG